MPLTQGSGPFRRFGWVSTNFAIIGGFLSSLITARKRNLKKSDKSSKMSTSSSISTDDMTAIVEQLCMQQHRDSTKKNYYMVWKLFNQFCIRLDRKPDNWESRLTLFMGYLIHNNKQSSTVQSYISVIKTTLKANKIDIAEDQYLLMSLTRACHLKNDRVHTRLPIRKGMLSVLLQQVSKYYTARNQPYLVKLYQALFSTMYFGLFRISEVASGEHAVKACDIHIGFNKKKFLFVLHSSKTHEHSTALQLIKISSKTKKKKCKISWPKTTAILPCPFQVLHEFARVRGGYKSDTEPFFVFPDNSPISQQQLSNCLKLMLQTSGFNEKVYGTHSLRSGRSCDLFQLGLSIETIKKLGQWKSNAVFRYLKNF